MSLFAFYLISVGFLFGTGAEDFIDKDGIFFKKCTVNVIGLIKALHNIKQVSQNWQIRLSNEILNKASLIENPRHSAFLLAFLEDFGKNKNNKEKIQKKSP